ncbi:hypothetical protein [Amycolatopsis minnesotensis]|uniref:Uncharacterized protein n=1 Tax=Amycolatopsis minnesotensis TaxID=337894 RepID=A0ABN2QP25_9PSEU
MLRTWIRQNLPRRFALRGFTEDEYGTDCELLAWDLGFEATPSLSLSMPD